LNACVVTFITHAFNLLGVKAHACQIYILWRHASADGLKICMYNNNSIPSLQFYRHTYRISRCYKDLLSLFVPEKQKQADFVHFCVYTYIYTAGNLNTALVF
jgi:hypothetical protein